VLEITEYIQAIDLSQNIIKDGGIYLLKVLELNPTIRTINYSDCEMTPEIEDAIELINMYRHYLF
jgi:hypothetical protein